jgi:hypothetical protein
MTPEETAAWCEWVAQAFPLGEVLAVGGAFADGTPFNAGATRDYARIFEEGAWAVIGDAVQRMMEKGCDARRSVWMFENGMLWLAARGDGAWMFVFTRRDLGAPARAAMTERLNEFVTR